MAVSVKLSSVWFCGGQCQVVLCLVLWRPVSSCPLFGSVAASIKLSSVWFCGGQCQVVLCVVLWRPVSSCPLFGSVVASVKLSSVWFCGGQCQVVLCLVLWRPVSSCPLFGCLTHLPLSLRGLGVALFVIFMAPCFSPLPPQSTLVHTAAVFKGLRRNVSEKDAHSNVHHHPSTFKEIYDRSYNTILLRKIIFVNTGQNILNTNTAILT